MAKVALAFGGNIGDVQKTFSKAIQRLRENGFYDIVVSSIYKNPAVGCISGTPDFTNAVLTGKWDKSPEELLTLTQKIERSFGRPQKHKNNESRTLDIDIILFGDVIMSTEKLTIPHPRAKSRDFVMVPLKEIAPDWIFPLTK